MKKTILLFVSVLTLALVSTSCSSDDDAEGVSIVGKWEISKEGMEVGGQEVLTNYVHTAGCSKDNIEFKADGTLVSTNYITSACIVQTSSSTYTKNGNTLTVTDAQGADAFTVKELSATTLKISDTYTEDNVQFTEVTLYTRAN